MSRANVNDPRSLESIYPRAVWEQEAGLNSQGEDGLVRGLLVESAPDAAGGFAVRRATRQATVPNGNHGLLVAPFMGDAYDAFAPGDGVHGSVVEKHDILRSHAREYDEFVGSVLEAARKAPPDGTLPGNDWRTPRG